MRLTFLFSRKPLTLALAVSLGLLTGRANGQQPEAMQRLVAEYKQAENLKSASRFAEAARLYETITENAERLFGPEHQNTADLLNNRGLVLEILGRYAEAQKFYLRCVRVAEQRFPNDVRLPRYLTNLGEVCRLSGELAEAERHLQRAMSVAEKGGPGQEVQLAESLHRLGVLLQEKGDLSAAESLFQRCLKLRETKLGPNDLDVADTLNVMGQLYSQLGQDVRALPLYKRALQIREQRLGVRHLSTAYSLNDLAVHYLNRRQYAEAEPLLRRALRIFETVHGADHPLTALACYNLGWICLNRDRSAEAEQLQSRAVRGWRQKLGPKHPNLAIALSAQGMLYFTAGKLDQAEAVQRQALKMREQTLGADHPNVAQSLSRLVSVLAVRERWDEAAVAVERELRLLRRFSAQVLPARPEHEQFSFLQRQYAPELHAALSLAWQRRTEPKWIALSAGWVLNGKAISQEVLAAQSLLARDSTDPQVLKKLAELRDVRAQIATLAASDNEEKQQRRAILQRREQELVRELGRSTGHSLNADPWVELERVREKLPPDTVLVEMARFPIWDWQARTPERTWKEERYAAWIIPAQGQGEIRMLDLGPARDVEANIRRLRQNVQASLKVIATEGMRAAEKKLRPDLEALAQQIVHPLAEQAGHAKHWILGADADLWLVPWAALPLRDDRYTVEKFRLSYVVSGRSLVQTPRTPPGQTTPPAVLAGPDFNLSPEAARKELLKVLPAAPLRSVRSNRIPTSVAELPEAKALAGTLVEANAIKPYLEHYTGRKPLMYLRAQAQESIVKALRSPQLVVLSTHGFFLPDQTEDTADTSPRAQRPPENPLLRCGLLLAGCNRRQQIRPGEEDGILTGLEIIGCDLRGSRLVVLSACETGLGDIHNGEGVAGLRQAFQLAGAQAVVASLWQVDDAATTRLMVHFFDKLAAGDSQAEALRQAQLALIASQRSRQGAAHPFFWAAFTLTGTPEDLLGSSARTEE